MIADYSQFPRVDRLLAMPALEVFSEQLGRSVVLDQVRETLAAYRRELAAEQRQQAPTEQEAAARAAQACSLLLRKRLEVVINATGVILHTNLGRAPLSEAAVQRLAAVSANYAAIELDLESGKRGRRGAFVEEALVKLLGVEAALVVNNCAASTLLMLSALARGKRVIISRGELVEIGGGFRVPDVLRESGAELVEVGTTNKTRLADYERALDQAGDGALILRVHPGNFQQTGFVERPSLSQLAELAQRRGVLLLKDLGGGALVDLGPTGFVGEPLAPAVVASGVDVVTFSTDKVLGGPQGGVAAGKRSLIEKLRSHPLHRALRLGRLPTVALEATLEAYLRGTAFSEVPALSLIATPVEQLAARVQGWTEALADFDGLVSAVPTLTEMGGGSLAGRTIASAGLRVRGKAFSADELLTTLRRGKPAVLGRIQEDAVILDARTVFPRQDEQLVFALRSALRQVSRLPDQR